MTYNQTVLFLQVVQDMNMCPADEQGKITRSLCWYLSVSLQALHTGHSQTSGLGSGSGRSDVQAGAVDAAGVRAAL